MMLCSRHIVVSYTRGSPLAFLITYIQSLPPVPPSVAAACQQSEERKALPTKTTPPSITHTRGLCLDSQHFAMNALSYNQTTKSRTARAMGDVASATATSTSPYSASPRTCVAWRTSAGYLAGTTTTARTVPLTPLGGLHAS